MKIGEVAKHGNVSVQTVRYYESLGLLGRAARNDAGYRLYENEAVTRIRFVRRAQSLGFSLDEIGELLELRIRTPDQCARVQSRVDAKLALTRQKLRDLQRIERRLIAIRKQCRRTKPTGDCPILKTLEEES